MTAALLPMNSTIVRSMKRLATRARLAAGDTDGLAPGPQPLPAEPPHHLPCRRRRHDADREVEAAGGVRQHQRAHAQRRERAHRDEVRAERLRVLQRTDISQMFIEKSNYYVNGGYYSDDLPTGCQVCICSRHNVWPPNPSKPGCGRTDMVYGRHPTSWEEALESLFVVAEQVLGFKKEQLQHLKQEWRR